VNILLLLATCSAKDIVSTNGDCANIKDCVLCAETEGCNFCSKGMGKPSYCTNATNAKDAGCDASTCASDRFITSSPGCVGGCTSISDCSACLTVKGCSWCFQGQNQGCSESHVKPQECQLWSHQSCAYPCPGRQSCIYCLSDSICAWSETEKTCKDASGKSVGDWTSNSQCPAIQTPTFPNRAQNSDAAATPLPVIFATLVTLLLSL